MSMMQRRSTNASNDGSDISAGVRSGLFALALIAIGVGWIAAMAHRANGLTSLTAPALLAPAIVVGGGLVALTCLLAGAAHPRWRHALWRGRDRSALGAPFWVRWTVLPGTRWLTRRLDPPAARRLTVFHSRWIVAAPMLVGILLLLVHSVVAGAVAPRTPPIGWTMLQLVGISVMAVAGVILLPLACVIGRASYLTLHRNPPREQASFR